MDKEFGLFASSRDDTTYPVVDDKSKPVRKKFAVPPVKVACLECRASRCRCDGNPVQCSNCTNKGKKCVYVQSKRGGSRIRKRKLPSDASISPPANNKDLNQAALSVLPESEQVTFAGPLSFVSPGGGLKQLDLLPDDSDFIFDGSNPKLEILDSGYETSDHAGTTSPRPDQTPTPIRTYSSNEAILSGYYTYIHSYFPVLPPPIAHQVTDNPDPGIRREPDAIFTSVRAPEFEPESPLSLAISATLALIPHPDDPNPTGPESVRLRREQAKAFAQVAFETIETETELIESNENPTEALSVEPTPATRQPFHLQNPVQNESIIALLLLSTFEYAQRGNVTKMRNRAAQALNAAMDLGLHAKGNEEGYYAEANKRTWWMTYITACQGAILSNSAALMLLYDPRFTTAHPTFAMDVDSWGIFLQSQQIISNATQFVIDLDATLKAKSNPSDMWNRMIELDGIIEPLVRDANTWQLLPTVTLDRFELNVAQSLRGIARIKLNSARIKLHRYNAFSDTPVFSKKHCDLQPSSNSKAPNCGCSTTFQQLPNGSEQVVAPGPSASIRPTGAFPFSGNTSANICYQCAFNIADSYSKLPFPQPIRPELQFPLYNPKQQGIVIPRMMPIFSCCAMQSSYAMIMLYHRTKSLGLIHDAVDGRTISHIKLVLQLQKGLNIILDALRNYSIAYEALGGMRDQIELAIQSLGFNAVQSVNMSMR